MRYATSLVVLLFAGFLAAQTAATKSPAPRSIAFTRTSSSGMMSSMPMVAPIFIEDDQTSSTLVVVNNSAINAGATASLMALNGAMISTLHVALRPHEERHLPIRSLLPQSAGPTDIGSISLMQDGNLKGMTIAAQLLMTTRGGAFLNYVDEELAMPSAQGSDTLRGVTDEHEGPVLVAISNLVTEPQQITIHCIGAHQREAAAYLTLASMATSITTGCTGKSITDIESYRNLLDRNHHHAVQGIEITGSGMPGTLAAFALAPHRHQGSTLFSSVPFADPAMTASTATVFAGVPIGPQTVLSDGIYTPRVTLANFSTVAAVSLSCAGCKLPPSRTISPSMKSWQRTLRSPSSAMSFLQANARAAVTLEVAAQPMIGA